MKLNNKVAIITGASSGIGEATAKALGREGVKVVLAARRKDRLVRLKEEIEQEGGTALIVVTDVTKRKEVQNMADRAVEVFGSIDILINNAGLMPLSFIVKLHEEEWDKMVDVNIKGVLNAVAASLPQMIRQKSGHIVNVSSVAGRRVTPGSAVYSATKFAVAAFSEGLRQELATRYNIRITSIEPGAVTTELTNTITDTDVLNAFEKAMGGVTFLESGDIAESILYAVSQPDRVNVNEILVMPTAQK